MTHPSRHVWVETKDNVRLSVREWGRADGPAILFVHGWSHCQLAFLRQYQSALADEFRLVSYDLRGHGESDHPDSLDAYDRGAIWADDLHAVIEGLGLERAVLVGWSFGGRIIAQYVHQFGIERVGGLNFVAVAAFADPDRPVRGPDACADRMLTPNLEDNIAATEHFVRKCVARPLGEADFTWMLAVAAGTSMKARLGSLQWQGDYLDTFRNIRIPSLAIHGRKDGMTLPHAAEAIAAKVAGTRILWFDESGHMPFWEEPERFNAELRNFALACHDRQVTFETAQSSIGE